ncbi:unnamed protein product [Ectocarpus sp. CCAP 1310/34]|nr:unnamed protein product [Ectocarpus sp. CCAP 1310/34]
MRSNRSVTSSAGDPKADGLESVRWYYYAWNQRTDLNPSALGSPADDVTLLFDLMPDFVSEEEAARFETLGEGSEEGLRRDARERTLVLARCFRLPRVDSATENKITRQTLNVLSGANLERKCSHKPLGIMYDLRCFAPSLRLGNRKQDQPLNAENVIRPEGQGLYGGNRSRVAALPSLIHPVRQFWRHPATENSRFCPLAGPKRSFRDRHGETGSEARPKVEIAPMITVRRRMREAATRVRGGASRRTSNFLDKDRIEILTNTAGNDDDQDGGGSSGNDSPGGTPRRRVRLSVAERGRGDVLVKCTDEQLRLCELVDDNGDLRTATPSICYFENDTWMEIGCIFTVLVKARNPFMVSVTTTKL